MAMTIRRKQKVLLVLITPPLVFFGTSLVLSGYSSAKWEGRYSRIRLGMVLPEIQSTVGLPPGFYEGEMPRTQSMRRLVRLPPLQQEGVEIEQRFQDSLGLEAWIGRNYVIWVIFDARGEAVGKYLLELEPDDFQDPAILQWLYGILRTIRSGA